MWNASSRAVSSLPDTCGIRRRRYGDARTRPSAGQERVIRPEKTTRGRTSSRHRRVSRQGKDHCRLPRRRLRRGIVDRAHPRSSEPRSGHSGRREEGVVVATRRQRRRSVPAALRRRSRQEEEGRRAEARVEELHRAPARDGRRPRRRGDRLAPSRGVEAEGAGQADGVPRDHAGGDRPGARRDARHRRPPRRRAGDTKDSRSALRLRGLARALEEGDARPLRRARPVGRDAARRRARARADAVRLGFVLGHPRHLRAGVVRGAARCGRRQARRAGSGLRGRRQAQVGHPRARRGRCAFPRRRAGGRCRSSSARSTRSPTGEARLPRS